MGRKKVKKWLILVGNPFYKLFTLLVILLLIVLQLIKHLASRLHRQLIILRYKRPKQVYPKPKPFILFRYYVDYKKRLLKQRKRIVRSYTFFLKRLKKGITKSRKLSINKFTLLKTNLTKISSKILKLLTKKIAVIPTPSIKHKYVLYFATFILFIIGLSALYVTNNILTDLPSPHDLATTNQEVTTKIYDRHGKLLYKIYKDKNRTPVQLSDIPNSMILATLAIEDAEFYDHPGFSLRGIFRALVKYIKEDELTGGSTITQQLVKNKLLSPEKTLRRKIRELALAVQVERAFSKDAILEMYLNEVSYGGTAYGVQAASRKYFGKKVGEISLAEAALLAGLPKSPTTFSPFGPNPDMAGSRQKEVLRLMEINKYITYEQRKNALKIELKYADNRTNILAPHFVFYTREILENKFGKETLEQGGLEVTTTLDYDIQLLAEKIVKEEVESLQKLNVSNGAALVINPQNGEILAMVGSIDYFDTEKDGNVNVTTSLQQPGSSIKVINYAYALSNGLTAGTLIDDSPKTFNVTGQPPYSPINYDGKYRGNLTLRSALAESRNIPAVKVLNLFGVENMIAMGQKIGITTWRDPTNYGLSLTLGGGEIKLTDLASVYATIANYGKKTILTPFVKATNFEGENLEVNNCKTIDLDDGEIKTAIKNIELIDETFAKDGQENINCNEQVLDPRVAFIITDILRDNVARSPSFGSNSLLNIPDHTEVAAKTGTSNGLRDNLAIGYNQDYLVAVWVGNNDNTPMARIASGITGATPIFNKLMTALVSNTEELQWDIPNGLIQLPICPYTGTLACNGCPVKSEWFIEGTQPKTACNPEWFIRDGEKKEISIPSGQLLPEAAQDRRGY